MSNQKPPLQPFEAPPEYQRAWNKVYLTPPQEHTDVANARKVWKFSLVGERSDGMVFGIETDVFPQQLEQQHPLQVFRGMFVSMTQAFATLETYRECHCRKDMPCKTHSAPTVQ